MLVNKKRTANTENLECKSCCNCIFVKEAEEEKYSCAKGGSIKGEYQKCYEPSQMAVKGAVSELLNIRCRTTNSDAFIGASILLDMYAGIPEEVMRLKHADVYGRIGHDNTGPARVCRTALAELSESDSTNAFLVWYEKYQKKTKAAQLKKASDENKERRKAKIDASLRQVRLDRTNYVILQTEGNRHLITLKAPEDSFKMKFDYSSNKYHCSYIKRQLEYFVQDRPQLKERIISTPRLILEEEYRHYLQYLPKWDLPYWLGTKLDNTQLFVLAVDGENVIPMCVYSNDVYVRPVMWIEGK